MSDLIGLEVEVIGSGCLLALVLAAKDVISVIQSTPRKCFGKCHQFRKNKLIISKAKNALLVIATRQPAVELYACVGARHFKKGCVGRFAPHYGNASKCDKTEKQW